MVGRDTYCMEYWSCPGLWVACVETHTVCTPPRPAVRYDTLLTNSLYEYSRRPPQGLRTAGLDDPRGDIHTNWNDAIDTLRDAATVYVRSRVSIEHAHATTVRGTSSCGAHRAQYMQPFTCTRVIDLEHTTHAMRLTHSYTVLTLTVTLTD